MDIPAGDVKAALEKVQKELYADEQLGDELRAALVERTDERDSAIADRVNSERDRDEWKAQAEAECGIRERAEDRCDQITRERNVCREALNEICGRGSNGEGEPTARELRGIADAALRVGR